MGLARLGSYGPGRDGLRWNGLQWDGAGCKRTHSLCCRLRSSLTALNDVQTTRPAFDLAARARTAAINVVLTACLREKIPGSSENVIFRECLAYPLKASAKFLSLLIFARRERVADRARVLETRVFFCEHYPMSAQKRTWNFDSGKYKTSLGSKAQIPAIHADL